MLRLLLERWPESSESDSIKFGCPVAEKSESQGQTKGNHLKIAQMLGSELRSMRRVTSFRITFS